MNDLDWIDSATACALLGIRPQTLYAYVSRKLLRVQSDAGDARRSLYARQDVEDLARRHRRPRARASVAAQAIRWGDPVLETAISHVRDGMLCFAERSAVDCASVMSLEQVAALHCRVPRFETVATVLPAATAPTPLGRMMAYLADRAAAGPPMQGRGRAEIAREGGGLLSGAANALLGGSGAGPVHERVAAAWGVTGGAADLLRQALVLLSDHELNPSTFAVRVCASTGASLAAALLAGLSTLSGPRHGGVATTAREAIRAAARDDAAIGTFLSAHADLAPYAFGYGHPLYLAGDPRAACLLDRMDPGAPAMQAVRRLSRRLDLPPNIDAALAVLGETYGLPEHAAFAIFSVGRMAGWIAHAIEQSETGQIIRPRARYVPVSWNEGGERC